MFASTIRLRCSNAMRVPSTTSAVVRTSRINITNAASTNHHQINNNNMIISQFRQVHLLMWNKTSPLQQPMKLSSFRRMESTTTTAATTTTTTAAKDSATVASTATAATPTPAAAATTTKSKGWWYSAELWGTAGALACWGMAGSASYVFYRIIMIYCYEFIEFPCRGVAL